MTGRRLDSDSNVRRLFFLSVVLFCTGFLVGLFAVGPSPDQSRSFTTPESAGILTILQFNIPVFVLLLSGVVTLGLTTVASVFLNGVLLGLTVAQALNSGMPLHVVVALVAPHALLELPALWLSSAVGLRVSVTVVRYLREKRDVALTLPEIRRMLRLSVVALLGWLLAAIIESEVTPQVAAVVT